MLMIVDYGQDEVAMSPEPEEGEVESSSEVMFGARSSLSVVNIKQRCSQNLCMFYPLIFEPLITHLSGKARISWTVLIKIIWNHELPKLSILLRFPRGCRSIG